MSLLSLVDAWDKVVLRRRTVLPLIRGRKRRHLQHPGCSSKCAGFFTLTSSKPPAAGSIQHDLMNSSSLTQHLLKVFMRQVGCSGLSLTKPFKQPSKPRIICGHAQGQHLVAVPQAGRRSGACPGILATLVQANVRLGFSESSSCVASAPKSRSCAFSEQPLGPSSTTRELLDRQMKARLPSSLSVMLHASATSSGFFAGEAEDGGCWVCL